MEIPHTLSAALLSADEEIHRALQQRYGEPGEKGPVRRPAGGKTNRG